MFRQLRLLLQQWLDAAPRASVAGAPQGLPGSRAVEPHVLNEIRRLQQNGKSPVLDTVIQLYLSDAPTQIAAMRTALARGDADALREAVHSLKGASAALGATTLVELCQAVEAAARTGIGVEVTSRIEAIETEYPRVQCALQGELERTA